MTAESRYLLVVSMDVDPAHEDLFNDVYDTEHIPYLMEVPGVLATRRLSGVPGAIHVGGAVKELAAPSPAYVAHYEIESPAVLTSPEWASAVERGRWPSVRPHTSNRATAIYRIR